MSTHRTPAEEAEGTITVAVAELHGEISGIASAGTPRDHDATRPVELFVLDLIADFHGHSAVS
ncbi:hypothetical protein [Spelaeicoccus albus]|uniref:Uncharacterized protein YgfB (UPF0149 family) n=1 Tax=Spelaeicoccus albus TaxID=1280376 RepID=A0A7Z0CZS9_9MICO|nr:hypothetical protein [Spelaeicoccus albus]NYI66549.1 uncharacterized protein YgfB (UPF0149 family) [Spelaeicoccus albus]